LGWEINTAIGILGIDIARSAKVLPSKVILGDNPGMNAYKRHRFPPEFIR
jgi:hypothetical protein